MAKLIIKDEHGVERVHELGSDALTIGRAPENAIRVTDQKFSRKHFQVEKDGEYYKVSDLGSTNGTRVNGKKITSERLRMGDVIKVGETSFLYDGPSPPAPVPAGNGVLPENGAKKTTGEAAKYVVVMLEGPDPGKKYDLGNVPFTVGRHPSNVLQLNDDAASSYHMEIKKEPIGYIVSDLGSTNGTRVRAKGHESFEKIVKTPLAHGMQIRIGKTVFEFRNISGPSADDQLLGTVPLDPEKLHDKIAERPSRPSALPKVLVGVLALVVFVGVIYVVLNVVPPPEKPDDPSKVEVEAVGNLLRNSDFSEGVTDAGDAVNWRYVKGEPTVRMTIDNADNAVPVGPDGKSAVLVIEKSGAKNPACQSSVMSQDRVPVDSGKVYELSGFMKGDGDGLFGLRVTWLKGERKLDQNEVVLVAPQPEWKERAHDVRPPAWADRAEVGVFAEGREGRACFDNLSFKVKPDGKVDPLPSVSFGEVGVAFETPSGGFSATAQGQPVVEGMDLALVGKNGQTVGSILSAIAPTVSEENNGAAFRGRLFDFNLQQATNYKIAAVPGTWGVDLSLAVDRGEGQTARPRLRFYLVGAAAKGDLEVTKGGNEEVLAGNEKHDLNEVGALLFNAGGSPQLYLKFSLPVEVETRREGERRLVQVYFPGELGVEVARENVGARKAFSEKKKELDGCLSRKAWTDVWRVAGELEEGYAKRFKEAADAASAARSKVEEAFKPVRTSIEAQIRSLGELKNFDAVKDQIQTQAPPWVGTMFEKQFGEWLTLVTKSQEDYLASQGEEKAREMLDRAKRIASSAEPQHAVVVALCNAVIQRYPKTKAAAEAQELLEKAETAGKEQDRLESIKQRLKEKARAYVIAGQWGEAAAIVEADKEYQDNRLKLKEITTLIQDWKNKARSP